MKHPTSRLLFAHWDALRGERAAPERRDLKPGAIQPVLPDLFILGLDAGGAAHVRLAGTRLCALFGRELTGEPFQNLWSEAAVEPGRFVETVLDETVGLVAGLRGATAQGETVSLELILLPLRHGGQTHARLLGALSPATIPTWMGWRPVSVRDTASFRVIGTPARALAKPVPVPPRRFVVHRGGRV